MFFLTGGDDDPEIRSDIEEASKFIDCYVETAKQKETHTKACSKQCTSINAKKDTSENIWNDIHHLITHSTQDDNSENVEQYDQISVQNQGRGNILFKLIQS